MSQRLCDPSEWQHAPLLFDQQAVFARIPHRHELALLHGILHHEPGGALTLGVHDSTPQDFWVRGHIPGRPIMPGVVMLEAAAQLCSFISREVIEVAEGEMFGFGGVNDVRFRGAVTPGERLLVAARLKRLRRTMGVFTVEAYAHNQLVMEGEVLGISL